MQFDVSDVTDNRSVQFEGKISTLLCGKNYIKRVSSEERCAGAEKCQNNHISISATILRKKIGSHGDKTVHLSNYKFYI